MAGTAASEPPPPVEVLVIEPTADQLAAVAWNEAGLVAAIVQDDESGEVLMMAWMSPESLALSLAEGRTIFWSRSRRELWRKGDTSGDRQWIRTASYDCDGDVLLFRVHQEGRGACHTGARSCFFRSFGSPNGPAPIPPDTTEETSHR